MRLTQQLVSHPVVLAPLALAVLAACAGLPGSSSVQARRPIADAPTAPPANSWWRRSSTAP